MKLPKETKLFQDTSLKSVALELAAAEMSIFVFCVHVHNLNLFVADILRAAEKGQPDHQPARHPPHEPAHLRMDLLQDGEE